MEEWFMGNKTIKSVSETKGSRWEKVLKMEFEDQRGSFEHPIGSSIFAIN